MSSHKNKTNRSQSTLRGEQFLLLGGLCLTVLAITVNVNDSTLLKPFFYYSATVATAALFIWNWLRGKRDSVLVCATFGFLFVYLLAANMSSAHDQRPGAEAAMHFLLTGISISVLAYNAFATIDEVTVALRWILWLTAATILFGFIHGFFPSLFSYVALAAGREFISTFGNASYFAGFLVLVLPLAGAMLFERKDRDRITYALATFCAATIVMLILTGARSSWIAAGISGMLFVALAARSRKGLYAFAAVAGILVAFFFISPGIFQSRLTHLFSSDGTSSFARRLYFYKGAWNAFIASPVFGNGVGGFPRFIPYFRSPDYWMARSEDIVPHAHNEYLEILSESGLVGFLAFAALIGRLGFVLIRGIHRAEPASRIRLSGYFCALLAVLIDNLGSFNLRTYPVAFAFWLIVGLALREIAEPERRRNIPNVSDVFWLRFIPIAAFAGFLYWYIPVTVNKYQCDAHFLKGFTADIAGRDDEAAAELKAGLEYVPTDAQSQFYYAASLMKTGRHGEAINAATSVLNDYPWYPKAHLIRSVSEFETGDTTAAFTDLRDELRQSTAPLGYYYASYFAYRNHDTASELRSLTTLLNNASLCGIPDNVVTGLDRYVKLKKALNDIEGCHEMIAKIRAKFGADAEVMAEIVECHGILGETDQVRATLSLAMGLPDMKEETLRRLQEIEAHLARPDSVR